MKKKFLLSICIFTMGISVQAQDLRKDVGFLKDFVAPAVNNSTTLVDVELGQIVYDRTTGSFRGLDVNTGAWTPMSTPSGSTGVISSGTDERIERATLTIGTSCAVNSHSGSSSWIATNTCATSGSSFTISGFGSPGPTCIAVENVNNGAGSGRACDIYSASSTSISIVCFSTSTQNQQAAPINLICMGPAS